jgi:nicotinate-nucleotide pyrophosphorylase (carboxylating)
MNTIGGLERGEIQRVVKLALEEDIGPGDITTSAVIQDDIRAKAILVAKGDCVVCGLDVAEAVFKMLDPEMRFAKLVKDGDTVKSGQTLAELAGNAGGLLRGERTALNFMQRLSGIATKASKYAERTKDYDVRVLDTRKTTPCLRELEKYAVRTGGAQNHRMGLYDAILIKDNHIKLAGLENAVAKAKKTGKRVEVEVNNIEEVRLALKSGADVIMLDNMSLQEMGKAVKIIDKKAVVEASGGVDGKDIVKIAKLGVDWISVGRLTHSVSSVEISMEIKGRD